MLETTTAHDTFVLEREYPKSPELVFAAFSDPAKKQRWYAVGENHTVEHFEMDFRPGGIERTHWRFNEKSSFPGAALTNEGTYVDIVPNRRIVFTSAMAMSGRCFSASLGTFEFFPEGQGTKLVFTCQSAFFEGSDGARMRQDGWITILNRLGEALAH